MIKAIETPYKGYRFRSRLEARWAVFLDAAQIKWEYEKEGYELPAGWYLPDFWIPAKSTQYENAGYWLEVKGTCPTKEEQYKCIELADTTGHTTLLVWGDICAEGLQSFTYSAGYPVGSFMRLPPKLRSLRNRICAHIASRENKCPPPPGFSFWTQAQLAVHLAGAQGQDVDWDDITPVMAARSARFEHGESPTIH